MFCIKCGNNISDSDKFCIHCGSKIILNKQVTLEKDFTDGDLEDEQVHEFDEQHMEEMARITTPASKNKNNNKEYLEYIGSFIYGTIIVLSSIFGFSSWLNLLKYHASNDQIIM
ncbi:MAG: zinc ribbon domain-containing protein, partial [Candidatus Omnitrophica bacterium]|nr:zinc ribbon domain-containing protein [Candidatus Omnitrophota bacterium]